VSKVFDQLAVCDQSASSEPATVVVAGTTQSRFAGSRVEGNRYRSRTAKRARRRLRVARQMMRKAFTENRSQLPFRAPSPVSQEIRK
jgi:hypothetical protein